MTSYVCFHGHFYQPSRVNPWTETWDEQPSAAPFRDWNTRIAAECYAPNAAARLLDDRGATRGWTNNYAWMSFDVGPTLVKWLRRNEPTLLSAMIAADQESVDRCGFGGAIAQAYHHPIIPLCDAADRRRELRWGLESFEQTFGRPAKGLWLPETAVDEASLEVCAAEGVEFVIVAAYQLDSIRDPETGRWLSGEAAGTLDGRAYRAELPSGASIKVVPYAPDLSAGISFGGWLNDGGALAQRLREAATTRGMALGATDGETYGHHHRYGEMALAYALERLAADDEVEVVNLEQWLEREPPTWLCRLKAESSWSCAHGFGRWRSDCGCKIAPDRDWHQRWRAPLREALDLLRDQGRAALAPLGKRFFRDAEAALDAYGEVIDRPERFEAWYAQHQGKTPDASQALRWLDTHRHLMAMYTSCGWFFDDVTGIEPQQNLRHAAYALAQIEQLAGVDLTLEFRSLLSRLPANGDLSELLDGFDMARTEQRQQTRKNSTQSARCAGLLLPVSSLGGEGPIGSLDGAFEAIDWMVDAGCSLWQILPLSPTDPTGSPYSSWSAWSGNPELVGLDWLRARGLIDEAPASSSDQTEYGEPLNRKLGLVRRAAERMLASEDHPLRAQFQRWKAGAPWALDAALFQTIKRAHRETGWWTWPKGLRDCQPQALEAFYYEHRFAVETWRAMLFFFEEQWAEVRRYAKSRGLQIVGDLPIYVAWDSVDVWCHPELFQLDAKGQPTLVAGCPPDAFSELGQRWGNPVYDWEKHAETGFAWWIERTQRNLQLCDVIRIDHFIGFSRYYGIPFEDEDARGGSWYEGPSFPLFEALEQALGKLPFWVEDLGDVDEGTIALRDGLGLPGMAITQFGFTDEGDNPHALHNHHEHLVVYPGTHDNDTLLGWWHDQPQAVRDQLGIRGDGDAVVAELLKRTLGSPAAIAVVPMQDVLGLDGSARFNTPGTCEENWHWRMPGDALSAAHAQAIRDRLTQSDRLGEI